MLQGKEGSERKKLRKNWTKETEEKQEENVENILMLKYYNFNWYFRVIPLAQTLPIIHPR